MCTPSSKKDNSAKKARREEDARQSRIKQGNNNIDLAFEGFDRGYFDRYGQDMQKYYLPQLDQQYGEAKKGLTFNLARSGNLLGSTAGQQYGAAHDKFLEARTGIANKALDATTALRSRIEDQRNNLYALSASSADPGMAISRSAAASSVLGQAPGYSPLGDVFSSFLNSGSQVVGAERQGYRGSGTGLFAPPPEFPSYYNNYRGSDSYVR